MGGVGEKVEEHLLELVRIGSDPGEGRLQIRDRANIVNRKLRRLQGQGGRDRLVEINLPPLGRLSSGEDQEIFDDLSRPQGLLFGFLLLAGIIWMVGLVGFLLFPGSRR
jgi:hypothetical protein